MIRRRLPRQVPSVTFLTSSNIFLTRRGRPSPVPGRKLCLGGSRSLTGETGRDATTTTRKMVIYARQCEFIVEPLQRRSDTLSLSYRCATSALVGWRGVFIGGGGTSGCQMLEGQIGRSRATDFGSRGALTRHSGGEIGKRNWERNRGLRISDFATHSPVRKKHYREPFQAELV